jgi:hypothetical protein
MRETARTRIVRPSFLLLGATAIAWGGACSDNAAAPSPSDAGGVGNNPDAALSSPDVGGGENDAALLPPDAEGGQNGPDGAVSPPDGAGPATAATEYCANSPGLTGLTGLSGLWVIRAQATQIIDAPLVGTLRPQTIFYVLATLTQSGTDVVATGRYCDRAEIDQPGSLTTVVVPYQWAHTEKPLNRTGRLVAGGDGVSVLTFPTLVEFAGMVPDLSTNPLPTSPTDPRVIDEDNDGHPGITINLAGAVQGSVYAVQRQTTAIVAIPVAADRFEGKLDFLSEQKVLDSTSPLITSLYGQAVASVDPTPCSSTFAMVKVADAPGSGMLDASAGAASPDGGGALGCEWVRANETRLFPQ